MRTRHPSRASRRSAVLAASAVLLAGAGLLTGASSAWACGPGVQIDNPALHAPTIKVTHTGKLTTTLVAPVPASVTAGGKPVDVVVRVSNTTGAAYQETAPMLELAGFPGATTGWPADFPISDVTVQVKQHGTWKPLPAVATCDQYLRVNTAALAAPLAKGASSTTDFRISLAAGTPKPIASLYVAATAAGDGTTGPVVTRNVPVKRLAPGGATTGKGGPTTSVSVSPVSAKSAALTASTTGGSSTPGTSANVQLAQTGGGSSTGLLIEAGAALAAAGVGIAAVSVRRRRSS